MQLDCVRDLLPLIRTKPLPTITSLMFIYMRFIILLFTCFILLQKYTFERTSNGVIFFYLTLCIDTVIIGSRRVALQRKYV